MGFRINTNVAALSAHANASMNNRSIDNSLNKLNSGFRINSAADDASGMAIADSLRSQASSLGQAIMNANDAIGIVQTADKAMDEQIKILDTIKQKAIQSAQDGQTTETRRALQADISRLMEELDNIGNTTSFNGQKLLSGTFSNKEFQIGAYSNETVKASIGPTTSDKIGLTRFETGHNVRQSDLTGTATVTFKNVDGINDVTLEPVKLVNDKGDISATTGLGALAEAINKVSDKTGIKANVTAQSVFEQPIKAGTTTSGFSINGVQIGTVEVQDKDGNGALRAAINAVKDQTGVEASVDSNGRLVLANRDGRGIKVEDNVLSAAPAKDYHNLVTQGAPGKDNVKQSVDLNLADTWTKAAGTEGSIMTKDNSFADVKNALGAQDAQIRKDATDAAKTEALVAKAANDVASTQTDALNTLKSKLAEGLENFRKGLSVNGAANQGAYDTMQSAFIKGIKDLEKAGDLDTISTALGDINTAAAQIGTIAKGGTLDQLQDLMSGEVKTYAETMQKAVGAAQQSLLDNGIDVTEGNAQTLNDALTAYKAGIDGQLAAAAGFNAGTAAARFGAIAALATPDDTYNTDAADFVGKEVMLESLTLPTTGAMQMATGDLAISDASTDPDLKAIHDMFENLKTQTTKEGANASLKKIDDKLKELVDAAEGKGMNTKEAQKGIIAHSLQQYFSAVKTGINEPEATGLGSMIGLNAENSTNMGRLSLVANNGRDIQVEVKDANGFVTNSAVGYDKNVSEATVSLRETNAKIDNNVADAMGFNPNEWQAGPNGDNQNGYPAGVMTLKGAQAMMDIAETAQKALEAIRSDLGSVQNQLVSTVNNISVTQVNVKAAESNIRDVDFAQESATFSKHQILAQSGVYAMSQANAVQQNVMRLLQ